MLRRANILKVTIQYLLRDHTKFNSRIYSHYDTNEALKSRTAMKNQKNRYSIM